MAAPRKTPAQKPATGNVESPATLSDAVLDTPVEETTEKTEEVLSPELLELQALRAELAAVKAEQEKQKTNPTDASGRPLPESELTPEQREIRILQDQLARVNGKKDFEEEVYEENVEGGILVHFLSDGVTSNGKTFYRGQEAIFGPEAYEETKNRAGRSWLEMTDSEQFARWGELKFRKGPWPGVRQYEEEEAKGLSISTQVPTTRV